MFRHIILPGFKLVCGLPWWWQSYMLKHIGVKKIVMLCTSYVHLVGFINRQRKLYHRLKCEWCKVIHYFIWACYWWKCFCDMKAIIQVYVVHQIIKSFRQCCLWETCHEVLRVSSSHWKSKFFHYNCVRHAFFLSCEITQTFTSQFSLS